MLDSEILIIPNLIIESQKLVLMIKHKAKFTNEDIDQQADKLQSAIDAFANMSD